MSRAYGLARLWWPDLPPKRRFRLPAATLLSRGNGISALLDFDSVMSAQPTLQPRDVVVYSRKGCHLCEIVKEKLTKLERRGGFRWREVDVDADDGLRRQFTDEVPVVFIDGRKAFKYSMDEQEFLKKLAS